MDDGEKVRAVRDLLFAHLCTLSLRRVRDVWAIHLLAKNIVEALDHRTGVWRKWTEEREGVVKSAKDCWLPIDDLREYLNGMPGPSLTRMDVAQRLRAFQEDEYGSLPDSDLRAGCQEIFDREKAEGTELPAIIGAINEWVGDEESRRWDAREAARRARIEEERLALEAQLRSGADCKWTPLNNSEEVYCRTNGRTYRLTRLGTKSLELHRLKALDDPRSLLIGAYQTRADATKAVAETARAPEPRW